MAETFEMNLITSKVISGLLDSSNSGYGPLWQFDVVSGSTFYKYYALTESNSSQAGSHGRIDKNGTNTSISAASVGINTRMGLKGGTNKVVFLVNEYPYSSSTSIVTFDPTNSYSKLDSTIIDSDGDWEYASHYVDSSGTIWILISAGTGSSAMHMFKISTTGAISRSGTYVNFSSSYTQFIIINNKVYWAMKSGSTTSYKTSSFVFNGSADSTSTSPGSDPIFKMFSDESGKVLKVFYDPSNFNHQIVIPLSGTCFYVLTGNGSSVTVTKKTVKQAFTYTASTRVGYPVACVYDGKDEIITFDSPNTSQIKSCGYKRSSTYYGIFDIGEAVPASNTFSSFILATKRTNNNTKNTISLYSDVPPVASPTISKSTLASSTTASSVTFKGTYTIDPSLSVSSIKVYNSNTKVTTNATVTTSSKSWSANVSLGTGSNTLTATITDSNSQTASVSGTITRNVPTYSAPTISRTTLASYTTATSVTFKGTYTIDSSLSVSSIKVYNSATGTTTTATVTTSSKSWSASITLGSVGTKNTLTATITDSNGQTATCSDYITRVAKPTISRTTLPSTTTSSSTTFSGSYTVDSNLSVSSIKVYNDNTGTTTTATVNTTNKTWSASISLGYGRNNLTATITDSNSSTATCTDYITRNTSVPSITCANPSSNVSVSGITSYTLSGTATAATSTYPISTVKVNSTSATLTAGSGNTKNWSITVSLADGTNTFNIVATDTYGSSNSMTRTITRNRTAPTITFTAPTNGVKLAYNASPYHWAGTLTKDPLATWSSFKLTMWDNVSSGDLDNVNAANGTWAVYTYMAVGKNNVAKVEATDSFGQTATATLTYSRKYDAPKITWSSPTNTAFITKTQTPITGLVDWYYLNGYTPVDGFVKLAYTKVIRGGTETNNYYNATLGAGSDTIITENGTDFHYWRQSWSYTPTYEGDFSYIEIAANACTADDSSSEDMYETRNFPTEARTILYSTKKPSITITNPTTAITVYSPTYTITGTCMPAFGDKYSFTSVMLNGALIPLTVTQDFPTTGVHWEKEITLEVGDNNISVYAVDGAANMSPTLTRTITYKSIDLYCNVEVDFDGLITNEIKMREFTCKAGSPNKVKYLRCYENGTQIGETVSGGDYYEGIYTMGISPDVEGKNEYYIEMEDYAGNKVKSSKFYVTYTVKTATITITSPTEGQVFKSKVTAISDLAADTTKTVTGSVTCGNTYTTVTEIAGDGTPITVSNPSGTTNFTYQHTTKVGTNSTIVTATNSAGNIATLARNFVYVPYMAPTIELSGVLKYTNNSSVTIKDNEWWVVLNHARASLVGTSNLDAITNVKVTSSDGKTVQLQFSEDENAETGENTTTYKISAKTLELVDTSVEALETPREITLTLVATSKFGEVTSKQIGKIKYFAGKPVITFTNAEQNLITNQPSWNILGTVTKYEHTDPVIYIDGNGSAVLTAASGDRNWTFDKKVSLPSDGGYDFLFKVTDIYGNEAEANYFIQRFTQPPLITITDPKENLITNSLEIASHVIGETKPAANFVTLSLVTVNGTPYTLAVAPDDRGYFAIDTVANGIVEGVNEITVRVTDSVGNVATVTRHLRLDTHAPLIKDILADSISVDTNGIIHLTCKVTDPD